MHSKQSWERNEFELLKLLTVLGWFRLSSDNLDAGSSGSLLKDDEERESLLGESLGLGFAKKWSFEEVLTSMKGASVGEFGGLFTTFEVNDGELGNVGRASGELLITFTLRLLSGREGREELGRGVGAEIGGGNGCTNGRWWTVAGGTIDDGLLVLTISRLLNEMRTPDPLDKGSDWEGEGCSTKVGRGGSSTSISGLRGPINRFDVDSGRVFKLTEEIIFPPSELPIEKLSD